MQALAFDFDGVISDSVRECYVVAVHTYARLSPDSRLPKRSCAEAVVRGEGIEALDADPLYAEFLRLMPYGNRAEDFGVALAAIDSTTGIRDQESYGWFFASRPEDWRDRFHRVFYDERAKLRSANPELWRSLHRPYSEVVEAIRRHAGELPMAIATAKDGTSVRLQLVDYGLADVVPEELVLDKETGVSKDAHMQVLSRLLSIPLAAMTFVDDKVRHLDSVASLGVRCALASWGYNGEEEHRQALERGYLVCNLEDIEETLFRRASSHAGGSAGTG